MIVASLSPHNCAVVTPLLSVISVSTMVNTMYNEDAEVRVGVIVRPLRGHWKPAKGEKGDQASATEGGTPTGLDRGIWKSTPDQDNIANMQFTSKMVYSNHNLIRKEASSFSTTPLRTEPTSTSTPLHTEGTSTTLATSTSGGSTPLTTSDPGALIPPCPRSCKCHITGPMERSKSPPAEQNRIPLPPDLEALEKKGIGSREKAKGPAEKSQPGPAKEERPQGSTIPVEKDKIPTKELVTAQAPPSDEIRVTSRPLPPKRAKPLQRQSAQVIENKSAPTSAENTVKMTRFAKQRGDALKQLAHDLAKQAEKTSSTTEGTSTAQKCLLPFVI
ncbi:hypothetical protein Q1695_006578 [Nippostrongylus brasiliensis]|nr:hypothetical protein Q1695_006578 [Nippostrongylus brasiliensis]